MTKQRTANRQSHSPTKKQQQMNSYEHQSGNDDDADAGGDGSNADNGDNDVDNECDTWDWMTIHDDNDDRECRIAMNRDDELQQILCCSVVCAG